MTPRPTDRRRTGVARGFTLIEVLVALGIVAIALVAGLQATAALTNNAERQSDMVLAQLCADNDLVRVRLSPQMPSVGDSNETCNQGGRDYDVTITVRPTPNPSFRRVDVQILRSGYSLLRVSTVVGRN